MTPERHQATEHKQQRHNNQKQAKHTENNAIQGMTSWFIYFAFQLDSSDRNGIEMIIVYYCWMLNGFAAVSAVDSLLLLHRRLCVVRFLIRIGSVDPLIQVAHLATPANSFWIHPSTNPKTQTTRFCWRRQRKVVFRMKCQPHARSKCMAIVVVDRIQLWEFLNCDL